MAVIASFGRSLVNFRLELLKRLVCNGHRVRVFSPEIDEETSYILSGIGVDLREIPMNRNGTRVLEDLRSLRALTKELRQFHAEVVLPYTMKPIIYGMIAARYAGVARRYALFTGLGYAFSEETPVGRRAFVRGVAIRLYRAALQDIDGAFVYNSAELADLRNFALIPPKVPIIQVPGSGVDLAHFDVAPLPGDHVVFLMIARLLKSKGIDIYVAAARILRTQGIEAELQLLGPLDSNPDSYSSRDVAAWEAEGLVRYLGETRDVRPFIQAASVIVLPAIHREGMPRAVLEGMSMGRAAITTDVPGCADSVVDGESGFIVAAGDAPALAGSMRRFLERPELVTEMGRAARKRAVDTFDVHNVNRILLQSMGLERAPL